MATDRHDIEEIVRIVRLEYERCREFGITPAPNDYRIAIEHWLRFGETPQELVARETAEVAADQQCCGKGPYAD